MSAPKTKNIAVHTSEILGLPPDILADLPSLTLSGDGRLQLFNYGSLSEFTPRCLVTRKGKRSIRVEGRGLDIENVTQEALDIRGEILRLELDGWF